MTRVLTDLPKDTCQALWQHLLPPRFRAEEAAFVYVTPKTERDATVFKYLEWIPVPPDGFASRSAFHFELTDETRGAVIKRAHDLDASLVELHSHDGFRPGQFSPSDLAGFEEFVPHVWWRLKGRPYLAVVASRTGFDGLVWMSDPKTPDRLDGIRIAEQLLLPTGLSSLTLADHDGSTV